MADAVDTNDVQNRLEAVDSEKDDLQKENAEFKEKIENWRAEFREEHDGKEPTEDDRLEIAIFSTLFKALIVVFP